MVGKDHMVLATELGRGFSASTPVSISDFQTEVHRLMPGGLHEDHLKG